MVPTLKPDRIIIARKIRYAVGDVVIASINGQEHIKRIQSIDPVSQKVRLVGDNSADSHDSRQYGMVPAQSIVAVVVWPMHLRRH